MTRFYCATLAMLFVFPGILHAGLANGVANIVLGQADFASTAAGAGRGGLNDPYGVAVDRSSGRVFVADSMNNRVLWWDAADARSGNPATGVLGQQNFTSTAANDSNGDGTSDVVTAATLDLPKGLFVDAAGHLWVADYDNNRVLRYSPPFNASDSGKAADFVLGPDTLSSNTSGTTDRLMHKPRSVFVESGGNVWVTDYDNHRALRFPPGNTTADLVLGHPVFTRGAKNDGAGDASRTAATLNCPDCIWVDDAKNVWIADHINHRLLRFKDPNVNGMGADLILGGSDFTSTARSCSEVVSATSLNCAFGVLVSGDTVWALERNNSRILRYRGTLSSGMAASGVIGQPDLASGRANRGGPAGPHTLNHPTGMTLDGSGNLWVCESGNSRLIRYDALRATALDTSSWFNASSKQITVTGAGIVEGTVAKFTRAGREIVAQNVSTSGESTLTGTFDFTGAPGGTWDLVLTAGDFSAVLPNALTVNPVKLTSVTPTSALNTGPVDVTVTGENFYAGAPLSMVKPGIASVPAQNLSVVSSTTITCRFDLTDVPTGAWNIVIPPGDADATLEEAFSVHFPTYQVRTILRAQKYTLGIAATRLMFVMDIPIGAFPEDVVLSISEPGSIPAVSSEYYTGSGITVEVSNDKDLQPLKELGMRFYYNPAFLGGLDRKRLSVCYLTEATSRWIPVYSRPDAGANLVVSRTNHLCIFNIMQRVLGTTIGDIFVYPNPYRPQSRTTYDDSAQGPGVVFDGLPARAVIRIFTIAGDEVIRISDEDGDGIAVWSGQNDRGEKAASGVYLYLITNLDDGSQKKKGRFAIIR